MNRRTFSQIKTTAKNILSDSYWTSFAVYLIFYMIINVVSHLISLILTIPLSFVTSAITTATTYSAYSSDFISFMILLLALIFICIVMIPIYLFGQYPLCVGMTRHFLNATNRRNNISDLFFAYKNHFRNVILISFLKSLYIFLWSLLFFVPTFIVSCILCIILDSPYFIFLMLLPIIPTAIKTYQYSVIDFLLAENPAIDRKRAFEICKTLTKNNIGRIFRFDLSFIGWIFLVALTLGIGYFFLFPYVYASFTQLYVDLRAEALAKGSVSLSDFAY